MGNTARQTGGVNAAGTQMPVTASGVLVAASNANRIRLDVRNYGPAFALTYGSGSPVSPTAGAPLVPSGGFHQEPDYVGQVTAIATGGGSTVLSVLEITV